MRGTILRAIALVAALAATAFSATAQDASPASAFANLVKAGNYEDANFYLSNGFVAPESIDTSQLFFDVLMEKYPRDLQANAGNIDTLYNYLAALKPIDLNQVMTCGRRGEARCLLVNSLMTGADRATIDYFVERGLDLNLRVEGFVPATVPLLLRLGTVYSLDDLNHFVTRGMVLGDELYPIQELASYQDGYRHGYGHGYGSPLAMPADYLTLGDQNLLDVMVIALGTPSGANDPEESARRQTLCGFIAYAAASFSPSFDYLLYLLENNEEFRGTSINKMEKSGRHIYQPFPSACVSLVQVMAASHHALQDVISRFAGEGDVETANWLIGIRKSASAQSGG